MAFAGMGATMNTIPVHRGDTCARMTAVSKMTPATTIRTE
jgi:hypothetical protein